MRDEHGDIANRTSNNSSDNSSDNSNSHRVMNGKHGKHGENGNSGANGSKRGDVPEILASSAHQTPSPDARGIRDSSRDASQGAAVALDPAAYIEALRAESASEDGLSLYVHLPFCPSRCLTCDHDTSVSHNPREIDRYIDAIEREAQLVTAHLGRRRLQQLHLGGGTPNYLSDTQLVRLLDIIDRYFDIDDDTEASLDANAHRASYSQLSLLRGLGFSGLNLAIRDLDPGVQRALGRAQSLPVITDVIEAARDLGFTTVSTDLVYGLPEQTAGSIGDTLAQLLSLRPDHINCFAHQRRQNTFEHQRAVDATRLPSLADKIAIFSRIVDTLCDEGYRWVGLDCFASPDSEVIRAQESGHLQHNWIGYTAQPGRSVLGLGASSVSDLTTIRVRNLPTLEQWRSALEAGQLPVCDGEILSATARAQRNALSDLLCNLQSSELEPLLDIEGSANIRALVDEGLIEVTDGRVAVTETGRFALHQLWGDSSPSHRWAVA
jgi:oxygen-independent coproporphyrinogen-3 oxidase